MSTTGSIVGTESLVLHLFIIFSSHFHVPRAEKLLALSSQQQTAAKAALKEHEQAEHLRSEDALRLKLACKAQKSRWHKLKRRRTNLRANEQI